VKPIARTEIAPGVFSTFPVEATRARLDAAAVVFVDLDGCLFPGISYAALAFHAWFQLAARRAGRTSRHRLPGITVSLPYLWLKRWAWRFRRAVTSREMLLDFATLFRGVDVELLRSAARMLPPVPAPEVRESLALLSRTKDVGILSMSIGEVAEAFEEQWRDGGRSVFAFHLTNRLRRAQRDGVEVFAGTYDPPFMGRPDDKAREAERRLEALGSPVPLTIGHDEDDVVLAEIANESGGLAVGIGPREEIARHFHVVTDWKSLAEWLRGRRE
jgi:hypothetical protein